MLRRLAVLFVFMASTLLAAPLATVDFGSEPAATLACGDPHCGASDCKGDAAPCVCVKCGHFGKMLMGMHAQGMPVQIEIPMNLFAPEADLPEGVSPAIDQPPRTA